MGERCSVQSIKRAVDGYYHPKMRAALITFGALLLGLGALGFFRSFWGKPPGKFPPSQDLLGG